MTPGVQLPHPGPHGSEAPVSSGSGRVGPPGLCDLEKCMLAPRKPGSAASASARRISFTGPGHAGCVQGSRGLAVARRRTGTPRGPHRKAEVTRTIVNRPPAHRVGRVGAHGTEGGKAASENPSMVGPSSVPNGGWRSLASGRQAAGCWTPIWLVDLLVGEFPRCSAVPPIRRQAQSSTGGGLRMARSVVD